MEGASWRDGVGMAWGWRGGGGHLSGMTTLKPQREQSPDDKTGQSLRRELGTLAAVGLGLGSILGTGVFVSLALGTAIAGVGVLGAIVLASLVATCNGLSSAQLAASHPVSGGTYAYGYRYLSPSLGFTAGWLFVCAKSASAATAALGLAGYILAIVGDAMPIGMVGLALGMAAVVTALVLLGVRRAAWVNTVIVVITIGTLLAFVAIGWPLMIEHAGQYFQFDKFGDTATNSSTLGHGKTSRGTWDGWRVLHATGLMFVAYTGYGRIATLGEEVRDPQRTIPRAILATLFISMVLYVMVAAVAVGSVGPMLFAQAGESAAPLEKVVAMWADMRGDHWDGQNTSAVWAKGVGGVWGVGVVLAVGAVTAMVGVLLNLLLGLSRVVLAMARQHDLPHGLAVIHTTTNTASPQRAVVLVAVIVMGLILIGDVMIAWSFSAFTVLLYYGLTNLAALRLPVEQRLYPRVFAWLGLIACFGLVWFIPWRVAVAGLLVIAVGHVWRVLWRWWLTGRAGRVA